MPIQPRRRNMTNRAMTASTSVPMPKMRNAVSDPSRFTGGHIVAVHADQEPSGVETVHLGQRLAQATGAKDDAARKALVEKALAQLQPDRKSTRLNSSHERLSRMPSSA